VPHAAPLDRQTSRQLDKGRLEVEARLDLHGLRQRDAHAQLRRFLKTAQAQGLKHVLVITGKGTDQTASRSFYEEDERGVLRQAAALAVRARVCHAGGELFASPRRLGGGGAL
jgi:DNA-nicking Smr family endonuclease